MKDENKDDMAQDDDLLADIGKAFDEVAAKAGSEPAPEPAEPAQAAEAETLEPAEKAEQTAEETDGQPRDEHGRFAPKAKAADKQQTAQDTTQQPQQVEQPQEAGKEPAEQQPAAPAGGPPPSWGIKAKAAWDSLPDYIRAEIAKREQEVSQGFGALREFKEIKQYADMAAQRGTSLPRVLDHYTRNIEPLERVLAQDVGTGLAVILQNRGYTQQQAAQLFGQLAEKYGGQAPQSNGAQPANGGNELEQLFKPLLSPIVQAVQQLRTEFGSRLEADRNAQLEAQARAIADAEAAFRADPNNRWYAEVEADMARLLATGIVPRTGNPAQDIKAAYETAVRMNPQIQEALIEQRLQAEREALRKKEQEAAEKAKKASRSVTGTRIPGTTIERKPANGRYQDDIMADVAAAYDHAANAGA